MSAQPHQVAIVGVGPRGISVIERIAAALTVPGAVRPTGGLRLHLIEESEMGAGNIWRTDQTRTLCMNTLAGAVTLFTEPGATVTAPVVEGPLQYDWIRLLRGDTDIADIPTAAVELFRSHPPTPQVAEDFAGELALTRTHSNPSRALYGAYLRWVFDVALALLPDWVEVEHHHARAISLRADGSSPGPPHRYKGWSACSPAIDESRSARSSGANEARQALSWLQTAARAPTSSPHPGHPPRWARTASTSFGGSVPST